MSATDHKQAPDTVSSQGANPVFLVGIMRSGTSLFYSLLNQHPQMALMFETDIWDFPEPLSRLRFRRNWLERQEFYNQALSRHRLIFGGRPSGLEKVQTPESLYRTVGDGKGAALWGEKSPFYCTRLLQLARRYPGCSFILLWRDPTEAYRSVVKAGRCDRFFRRRGMLSRLIFYQEQMIKQAAGLHRAGARVHDVTYADLIDHTEGVCRGVCGFLGIPYDSKMLDLAHADFSAVYREPQHDHLRRGVIQRQQHTADLINPAAVKKLQRFRARWSRLNSVRFDPEKDGAALSEPSLRERVYHKIAGSVLSAMDNTKRALFEFLPLPWLRTYRQTARWLFARDAGSIAKRKSRGREFAEHWITILSSFLLLGGLAAVQFFSNPRLTFLPLYLIPCAVLTLVINRRWGTYAALVASFIGPALLKRADADYSGYGLFFWNWGMRFILLEFVVWLLDHVRIEMNSGGGEGNISK